MKTPRETLGRRSEAIARAFLEGLGWRTHAVNYRTPWGEIDLVMWDGPTLVLLEVRGWRSTGFGPPEASLGPRKRRHLLQAAQRVVQDLGFTGDWRIDLVTVRWEGNGPPAIFHLPHILGE
jgi:putative endonuclease